jgi:Zn-dependent protease
LTSPPADFAQETKLPPSPSAPPSARRRATGFLVAGGLVALKVIKGAELAKLALFGAALWSIALFRPLPFAIALIYAILVHETGHILAMRYRGLKTSGIWFVPFVGAVAVAKQSFRSQGETFFVAIAGPVFGLLSVISLVAAQLLLARSSADAAAWVAYASAAAFINLFNLLPIGVLDGGRIVKSLALSLSPRLSFAIVGCSILLCGALLALSGAWVLAVLLLLSIFELIRPRAAHLLPPMSRKAVIGGTALYVLLFVLFAALGLIGAAASTYLLAADATSSRPARTGSTAAELDPVLSTLLDAGCAVEGQLRSISGGEPADITFANHSAVTLSVYWLNYEGQRAFYAQLRPGQSLVQKSHAPNPWVIATPSGECVAIVRASATAGTAVVRSTAE